MPLPVGQTVRSSTATNLTTGDTSGFSNGLSIPAVGPITAPLAPVAVNTAINISASFTDAIPSTTHTAVWNWGDNTTSPGSVSETNGSGTLTGSHTYTADGVYTVTLTVTNTLGGSAQSMFQYVVIYNPSAGFVTGGGWITSPAGAYAANTSLTGQANFGFNARYHSGDTVPAGSTQFQFPAANLTFQSTSYDWLVITTNQAQYQGSGTINGAGNYGFLVTALDSGGGSTPDKLRLKIWDKNNNNAVVYDTQPGAPTTAAPTTVLGGGRIQVHTNAQLVAGGANPSGGNPDPLTPQELQPIVQEAIALWRAAGIDAAQLSALSHVAVGIADFQGPWLGMGFPGAIWIDVNAAGYGWYIDSTPGDASAFHATPGNPAWGKVDLLTVVVHELGHELGFDDTADGGLMGVFLPTGTRRLPVADQAVANSQDEGTMPTEISGEPPLPAAALLIRADEGTADLAPVPTADRTTGTVPPLPQISSVAAPANDYARSVAVLDALLAQLGPDPLAAPVPDSLASATALCTVFAQTA
jgi:PKD repeat protein